jgi:hypothetical protein
VFLPAHLGRSPVRSQHCWDKWGANQHTVLAFLAPHLDRSPSSGDGAFVEPPESEPRALFCFLAYWGSQNRIDGQTAVGVQRSPGESGNAPPVPTVGTLHLLHRSSRGASRSQPIPRGSIRQDLLCHLPCATHKMVICSRFSRIAQPQPADQAGSIALPTSILAGRGTAPSRLPDSQARSILRMVVKSPRDTSGGTRLSTNVVQLPLCRRAIGRAVGRAGILYITSNRTQAVLSSKRV